MAEQEHIKRTPENEPVDDVAPTEGIDRREARQAELDDLLDEIDEVLETNAEDFVKSYIQKGGE